MSPSRPDILYVLAHGFAGRMVLHSDLVPELRARGLSVAVMAPAAGESHFRDLCTERGAMPIAAPHVDSTVLGQYGQMRRYLFEDYQHNAALRAKHEWDVHLTGKRRLLAWRSHLGYGVNALTLRAPRLKRAMSRAETRVLRNAKLREALETIRPRLVVSTYPVAWLEALTILEAKRLGLPTVGQLLSWDNISCKGRFAAVPDRFISWGPIMTSELAEYYGAARDRVVEAGVAHFDLHRRPVEPETLAGHLTKLGLDAKRPYLFFGMSAGFFAPREIDIVAWLAQRAKDGAFGQGMQLLVRPHPQNIRGAMKDLRVIETLERIAENDHVAVDFPEVVSDQLDMAERDMLRLAALLDGASVTLNSGSTLTIDAMMHDRPVILTSFDADAHYPWHQSARRLKEFPHLAKLLSFGGVRSVGSFDELEAELRAYLDDPSYDRDARRRTLEAQCHQPDGQACKRIADGLARFVTELA